MTHVYRTGELRPDPRSVLTTWTYEDDSQQCDPWIMARMEAEEQRLFAEQKLREKARTQGTCALDMRKVA